MNVVIAELWTALFLGLPWIWYIGLDIVHILIYSIHTLLLHPSSHRPHSERKNAY